ncbi:MAG: ABC transporter permease [Saccharofermentans sp.]|nr:ABC transporter permease [Saccharofermentans sp.]
MKIVLKHTFKNIFAKFGRTLLLVLCLFMCALVACFCLDLTGSLERTLANAYGAIVGSADVIYSASRPLDTSIIEDSPECEVLNMQVSSQEVYRRDPSYYMYVVRNSINVAVVDTNEALNMKVIYEELNLGEGEIAISESIANNLQLGIGDTITMYDDYSNPTEFVITNICGNGGLFTLTDAVVDISCGDLLTHDADFAYVNVVDSAKVNEAYELIKNEYIDATVQNISSDEDNAKAISQITSIFTIAFVVCVLVVVITTLTVSGRIINERMSVVGTLRSIGVSPRMTTVILLLENIIYALLGSIPAILLYLQLRGGLLDSMFTVQGEITFDFGSASPVVLAEVIIGMCLLQCACAIRAAVKASRTAIRDIIFDNKDTEYVYSKTQTYVGLGLLLTAFITVWFKNSFVALSACMVAFLVSIYLLFPYASRFVSGLFIKLAGKKNLPVAKLAFIEAKSKKNNMASSALIVIAVAVAIMLYVFADSEKAAIAYQNFTGDIVLSTFENSEHYEYYDHMEGIENVERSYYTFMDSSINGEEIDKLAIYANDGSAMLHEVIDMPEEIADDGCYIDFRMSDRYGIKEGDEIEVIFGTDSYIPLTLTLRVDGFVDSVYTTSNAELIALSVDTYTTYFYDVPTYILIDLEDDANVDEYVERLSKYSATTAEVKSIKTYYEEFDAQGNTEIAVVNGIANVGILLVIIGVISNQLISFEARKKEIAGLLSVSMSRSKMDRMLLLETAAMAVTPLVLALPLGLLGARLLFSIFEVIGITEPIVMNIPVYIARIIVLFIVFCLTVIFPQLKMRKMNIAAQLKYE